MRFAAALTGLLTLSACQKAPASREMVLEPGPRGTFLALMTETAAVIEQPATENEPEFKFRIRNSPSKGISVGTSVGGEGQGDLSETQLFTPASITKVITSSIALKLLGPEFRFRTRVSWWLESDGQTARDLTIKADGDPLTNKGRLKEIVQELKKRGIKRISGKLNLVSADPRKDLSIPAFGLDQEDYLSCYGARVQNFNLLSNCSSIQVSGWNQARWIDSSIVTPLRFADAPQVGRLIVASDLGAQGQVKGYVIRSVTDQAKGRGLPVTDAKSWYGNALVQELKSQGFDIAGASSAQNQNLPENESFELTSITLAELTKNMNKVSDNFLAEALYKASAGFGTEKNINEAALSVVNMHLLEWLRTTGSESYAKELTFYDGAGLSRANKVTPRAFLAMLKAFTKEPWFPTLWDSLPIAGVDGTLRGRMGGSAAGKLVRAKTGTLKGAYQLAGYIPKLGPDGTTIIDYVPFVVLTATTPKNSGSARAFQDKLLGELADQVNRH